MEALVKRGPTQKKNTMLTKLYSLIEKLSLWQEQILKVEYNHMQKQLQKIVSRSKPPKEQGCPVRALHYSKQRRAHRERIVNTKGYIASQGHEIMWSHQEMTEALNRLSIMEKSAAARVGQVDHGPPEDAMRFKKLKEANKRQMRFMNMPPPASIYQPAYVKVTRI